MKEPTYQEFLLRTSMSAGIYTLPTGSQDPQEPHKEDELYYVLSGSGVIEVGEEKEAVSPGSAVFIPAYTHHRFSAVKEELKVLVIFSPPEDSST
jgi:mannose-6-phosphate isomerase-like protein (cupin superfamily)